MTQQLRQLFSLTAVVFLIATAGLQAQEEIGPKAGSEIEDFVLMDQTGTERRFSDLLSDGPVAVVFHRSADW